MSAEDARHFANVIRAATYRITYHNNRIVDLDERMVEPDGHPDTEQYNDDLSERIQRHEREIARLEDRLSDAQEALERHRRLMWSTFKHRRAVQRGEK